MIRKLKSGQYRLYSRKVDTKTGSSSSAVVCDGRKLFEERDQEFLYSYRT